MQIHQVHSWDMTPAEAIALQKELTSRIVTQPPLADFQLIAGADVSYNRDSDIFYAAVVVLRKEDAAVVEVQHAIRTVTFPYIPGLLSFREAPVLLEAFAKLQSQPDVIMMDGQGIAHPRRLGIASHIGLWLDIPCFGCAKSLLYGQYKEPDLKAGSLSPLSDRQGQLGYVVRTKNKVKPVFVSIGNHIDLDSAVRITLEMCRGYRLPEPTRQAHNAVNDFRRENMDQVH